MNITFQSSETVAEGTMLFHFSKPAGFDYRAGQSVDLTLPSGAMHPYSLVSAPHEDFLAVATRMRDSEFKRELKSLPQGTEVTIDGPFGSFFLHENTARPAVFLVGGIGVTPFYSMLKDAAHRSLPHAIVMLYANKRPEDAPFLTELFGLADENPHFMFVPTMDALATSGVVWTGEAGKIDRAMLEKYAPRDGSPIYYLAGPKGMVTAMRTLLADTGVSGDDVRFEEFSGY